METVSKGLNGRRERAFSTNAKSHGGTEGERGGHSLQAPLKNLIAKREARKRAGSARSLSSQTDPPLPSRSDSKSSLLSWDEVSILREEDLPSKAWKVDADPPRVRASQPACRGHWSGRLPGNLCMKPQMSLSVRISTCRCSSHY